MWGSTRAAAAVQVSPARSGEGGAPQILWVRQMARDLPSLRARIQRDFRRKGLGKEKVCAGIVRLISHGFFRVGSEKYQKENNTFGITTMRKSHVLVLDDTVVFEYRGKRAITQRNVVVGKDLARFVNQLLETPGPRLFRYLEDGKWQEWIRGRQQLHREHRQFPTPPKDFRPGVARCARRRCWPSWEGKEPERAKKNVVTPCV